LENLQFRQKQAKVLRVFRKIHRIAGVSLFLFLFCIGVTGLLLGWKKNSGGLILADTAKGTSTDLSTWLPMHQLADNAIKYIHDSIPENLDTKIDRIDVRPDKGIVKITFKDHFVGVQVDGQSGLVLKKENRNADFIEQIHDGSLVDRVFGLKSGFFKLFYTTVSGLGLLIFCITGFWLWYGPKMLRKK
jgi:uncharacterized iron-regulated membrane protein